MINLSLSWFKTPSFKMRSNWLSRFDFKASATSNPKAQKSGCVYLVGAGCGDAELLTLKAHRLLQQAEVVLYDYLVNPEIIDMIPPTVHKVFVGKKCGKHSMTQKEICQELSKYALAGKTVVRLKGGDPSIFGRAAEETTHLQTLGINFAIVPGVTAASGCAAWSGLPLTHRETAHSVRFVTAHFKNDKIKADWENYAESNDTLVFYMGLSRIADIAQQLFIHGKAANTPIAIIDQGTTNQHACHISTLVGVESLLETINLTGPALVIVGDAINHKVNVNSDLLEPNYLTSVVTQ